MPAPLGEPLEPLPMVPEPGDVGLVLTPRPELLRFMLPDVSPEPEVPEVPEVPDVEPTGAQSRLVEVPEVVAPLALPLEAAAPDAPFEPIEPVELAPAPRAPDALPVSEGPLTVPGGQSELAPDAEVPWVLDEPVIPDDPVPLEVALPLEPLDVPNAGVLGSTLLPVPRVAELIPDAPGVVLCAVAIPAEHSKASINAVDACFLMMTPEEKINPVSSQRACHPGRTAHPGENGLISCPKPSRI